ncbi:hypothetical protein EYZ11_001456 [Aspergillus tanneri]|uniref:Glutamyl-tRNA synthetase n=1 Tax=Aspergillus tanneri TaxID=1220188 RepID=A0A4V3UQJ5_9EURO|nr:uncharacterized protein ATNIH1004_008791 [Aspergillus tanneri]KAA8644586.1 hypothetical protein ATNIH1004_008791 [Aspergillus tanneri]THC99060.1 hypothetical protein EYZ11_001456 [Aspergillus tanneri]
MTAFDKAMRLIDAAHAEDPHLVPILGGLSTDQGVKGGETHEIPYELHYANKMTTYLHLRCPHASDTLRLAIRAQHLRRWEVPRETYPSTKAGYHAWRSGLQRRQAELVASLCEEAGYSSAEAMRVATLVRKESFRQGDGDEEAQVLEDVACLVFLDDQFAGFRDGREDEKIVTILKKTWAKMSPQGRDLALGIEMGERERELVVRAIS